MTDRSDLVSVYLPITAYGVSVTDALVNIRPVTDEVFPFGISADVWIEDKNLDEHPCSTADGDAILARIRMEQPLVWAEIEAQAESNHLEGASYDASGNSFYAEVA